MSDYVSLQTEAPEWFLMPLGKFPNPSLIYKKFQDLHSALSPWLQFPQHAFCSSCWSVVVPLKSYAKLYNTGKKHIYSTNI